MASAVDFVTWLISNAKGNIDLKILPPQQPQEEQHVEPEGDKKKDQDIAGDMSKLIIDDRYQQGITDQSSPLAHLDQQHKDLDKATSNTSICVRMPLLDLFM
uniref:Uncharacterized protein n=1 Tax=Ditylenchus dipsaci TaxID=166011 RepID=A0A915EGY9_9BILA